MNQHSSGPRSLAIAAAAISLSLATLPGCERNTPAPSSAPTAPSASGPEKQPTPSATPEQAQRKPFTPPADSLDSDKMKATLGRTQFISAAQSFNQQVLTLEKRVSEGTLKLNDEQAKSLQSFSASAREYHEIISYCLNSNPDKDLRFNPALGENSLQARVKKDLQAYKAFMKSIK